MKVVLKDRLRLIVLSLIAGIILSGQTSYAIDIKGFRKSPSCEVIHNDGKFGLVRAEEMGGKSLKKSFVSKKGNKQSLETEQRVILYSAYTSYTSEFGNDTCWPWVNPDEAFLFVAFRVDDNMKVDIRWSISLLNGEDSRVETMEGVGDSETGDSLSPDYWHYAWWNPDEPLKEGIYKCEVRVKPSDSNIWSSKAFCRFEVTNGDIEEDEGEEYSGEE